MNVRWTDYVEFVRSVAQREGFSRTETACFLTLASYFWMQGDV